MHIRITQDSNIGYSLYRPGSPCIVGSIGRVGDFCLHSKIFSLLTLGHLHSLVHEMGHAIAYIVLTGDQATINLSTKSCYGSTKLGGKYSSLSPAARTWVDVSGPLADIIFSVVLIVGIFGLTQYVPMHQGLSLGLRIAISGGAGIWIVGEFFYAGISACQGDSGDFGQIAARGRSHLIPSTTLLLAVCALGALSILAMHYSYLLPRLIHSLPPHITSLFPVKH